VILLLALLSGRVVADDLTTSSEQLVQNLAKWRNQGIKNYRYQLHFTGHVAIVGPLPAARVVVRNGAVVESKLLAPLKDFRAGSRAPTDPYVTDYFYLSISDLFEKAADSIQFGRAHPGAVVTISYDARYGFPVRIEVNDPNISDAEGAFLASEFEILK